MKDQRATTWRRRLAQWDRPLVPGLLTFLGGIVFVLARWFDSAHRHLGAFIVAGQGSANAAQVPSGVVVFANGGYDGQFYYRLALAPWNFSTHLYGITIDTPIRFQRIGYPAVAWVVSFGRHSLTPLALVVVNIVALGALGLACGRWAQLLGRHALWGLLPASYFGFIYSLSRDLTEILAAALLVGGLVAVRTRRPVIAGLALAGAVLTRETALLFVFSYGVLRLIEIARRNVKIGHEDLTWTLPLLVFALWQLTVRVSAGVWPLTSDKSSNFDIPFRAIIKMIPTMRHASSTVFALMLISGVTLAIMSVSAFLVIRQSTATPAERLAFVLAIILVVSLSANIWIGDPFQFRTFNDAWIYGTGILIGSRRSTLLSATALAGSVSLAMATLWKIATI